MARSTRQRVEDILDAITTIRDDTLGMSFEKFAEAPQTQRSVLWSIGVIGEASRHMPQVVKDACSDIPWADVIAMRNRVLHEYFRADPQLIWNVIEFDLAPLEQALRATLISLPQDD